MFWRWRWALRVAGPSGESGARCLQGVHLRREGERRDGAPPEDSSLLRPACKRSAALPKTIETTDRMIDFKHPDGKGAQGDVGLRLLVAKRAGPRPASGQERPRADRRPAADFPIRVGRRGCLSECADGHQPYGRRMGQGRRRAQHRQSSQRGISGPRNRGELNSEHYRTLQFIHVIRPRNLTDAQRANIVAWATRLTGSAKRVYPKELSFNQDYNAPKYRAGQARRVRQAAGTDRIGPGPAPATSACSARSLPGRCSRSGIAIQPNPIRRSRNPVSRRA